MVKKKRGTGLYTYNRIQTNKELEDLEIQGFIQGEKKGKSMNIPLAELKASLSKQFRDWLSVYDTKDIQTMKKAIADLRNVAGCIFLKLLEEGDKK